MGNIVDSILFQPPPPSRLKENKIIWLRTALGNKIPAFHIEYSTTATKTQTPPITILYSHANAEDLGCIYPWCKYLSRQLKVNIFAYDYTGYGLAIDEGKPNEAQCYADIDAAYDYLRLRLNIPANQIVLYGRSLGSGPSCYLAAETSVADDEETVGGLILHAPFLSVFRIVIESGCTLMGDQFPNVDYIPNVMTPTLLIHGKVDKVVPVHHSKTLYDKLDEDSRTPPLFIDDMGHNNVQLVVRDLFLGHLKNYLDTYVRAMPPKKAKSKLSVNRKGKMYAASKVSLSSHR
jgi:fermentation-respiration switch protein FrsA (DUF1100 family)